MKRLSNERSNAEILRRLKTVRPDSQRRWGRMSAHQMICHLSDAFRMATGAKAVSDATGPLEQTVLKWIALYSPLPWPHGILTRPEVDQEFGGTCPTDFASDVAALEALVESITTQPVVWSTHPIFGKMSDSAWRRWAYLHMDHHLRQFGA
jgi:Protein of unknown function (DUF1569)